MTRPISWCRAGLLALLVAAAPAGSDGDPDAYRVHIGVTPGSGSIVQRLSIPAAILVAAQTPDLSDLRLFDARGRAMPIARAPAGPGALRRDTLKAMPILGSADELNVKRVSLRLDTQGRARIAQVEGDVAHIAGGSIVLGALFDARAISGSARAIALDIDVPESQPVTVRVEASHDLSTWRRLGEKTVYRASSANADETSATVALGMAPIADDYLKVTWSTASRALSPVVVRGASVVSRRSGPAAMTYAEATLPPPRDHGALLFAVPFATPIATIRLVPQGDDVLVPVRILGRDDAEQPWTLLGTGTAARAAPADIALGGRAFRTLMIEPDPRTPGFTSPPAIRLGFAARDLLFLAAGTGPYVLAAGRAGTSDAYLATDSLTAQAEGKPAATAVAAAGDPRVSLPEITDASIGRRKITLWAVLLFATGLLGLFAWTLWRRNAADAAPSSDRQS
ncbi:DUF3999 family protein [Sphingomonas sp. 1P08PE]|uniref:DUF3999 family protein n=1 Tax=Sphingomonas sp. 1P08PE TaxID=554122 RepID=UPI0039A3F61B